MFIESADRCVLRELARKHFAYSKSGTMQQIMKDWKAHNAGRGSRPMVYLEINAYRDEVVYPFQRCKGSFARAIEEQLLYDIVNFEHFHDDKVVTDYFPVSWDITFNLFGLKPQKRYLTDSASKKLAYHVEPVIHDLKDDFHMLGKTEYSVDRKSTMEKIDVLSDAFGDLLPIKPQMNCISVCLTQQLVFLMGMETLFLSMCDYPDEFHKMMRHACDDYLSYFNWLETEGLLFPTNAAQRLGQGSYCFTEELPAVLEHPTVKDVWGFMDSQESAPISPDMFYAFIFPYYKEIGDRFGLLSYGCCEPIHPIWDKAVSTFQNLRKVSVSPWCDIDYMGERLRNSGIIFHRKPSAGLLMDGEQLDEERVRGYIQKTALAARGCALEIAQRDVCSIHGDFYRARRYIELVRETAQRYWQP